MKHFLTLTFLLLATAVHATPNADKCEALWHQLTPQYLSANPTMAKFEELLQRWQQTAAECQNTGVYEYRLAVIYEKLGADEKADALFRQAAAIPSGYAHLPQLSILLRDLSQIMKKPGVKAEDFSQIEKGFDELVGKYNEWYAGFEHFARLEETLGKYDRAIELAKKAIELDPTNWSSYKVLTVAYTETGEHLRAIDASGEAMNLNKNLMADPKFMLALAMAYAESGQSPMSDQAVGILKKNAPGIEQTDVFIRVVKKIETVKAAKHP